MKIMYFSILIIILAGVVSAECTDSDGGKNKYELGTVTDQENSYQDLCEGKNIQEYFCSVEGIASYTTLPCVNGCLDGACQIANETSKASAPEEETNSNLKLYVYGAMILLTIGIYIYVFKWKKKKRRY